MTESFERLFVEKAFSELYPQREGALNMGFTNARSKGLTNTATRTQNKEDNTKLINQTGRFLAFLFDLHIECVR
jgi:hypothetical protein